MAETTTTPSENKAEPLAGFASFSDDTEIDLGTQATPPAQTEGEPPPADDKPTTETVAIPSDTPKGDDKPKGDEKPADDKPAEEEDVFSNPDASTSTEEENATWTELAKESGFEIKEDTFEAYKEAQKTYIETQKQEAVKNLKELEFNKQIEALPAESQLLIMGLKTGLTQEQILAPFQQLNYFKSLDDADLVAEDLKLKGFSDDVVMNKIEKMTEDGKLELEAKELRTMLDINEQTLLQNKLTEVKTLEENIRNTHQTKMKEEAAVIVQQLDTVEKFMDATLSKNSKKFVADKLLAGAYNDAMRDPKTIAQFALFVEYGEKGIANLKNKSYERGRDEKVNKLHNVPPVIKTGSQSGTNESAIKDPVGNWGAMSHLVEEGT